MSAVTVRFWPLTNNDRFWDVDYPDRFSALVAIAESTCRMATIGTEVITPENAYIATSDAFFEMERPWIDIEPTPGGFLPEPYQNVRGWDWIAGERPAGSGSMPSIDSMMHANRVLIGF